MAPGILNEVALVRQLPDRLPGFAHRDSGAAGLEREPPSVQPEA